MREFLKQNRDYWVLGFAALISSMVFVLYTWLESGLGFPLDDAWIHHTFARNLAQFCEWSFIPGEPSGASTGPLWGALLAVVYWVRIDPVWGNYLYGFLILWFLGTTGYSIGKKLLPDSKFGPLLIGFVLIFEWHLVWSALSGMETMLLGLLALWVIAWLLDNQENWWLPGLLVGVSIWIRPDGITLLGPVLLSLFTRRNKTDKLVISTLVLLGSILMLVIPYFLFNLAISGEILPNTFYAKQAEYAFLYDRSLISRIGTMSYQLAIGVGIALLPGLFLETKDMIKDRDWTRIGALLWVLGYIVLYSWRLPVSYQHARYIMPIMPALFLLGTTGVLRYVRIHSNERAPRFISRAWVSIAGALLFIFWGMGARAFALDVGVINTEMVNGAIWVSENTAEDSIIAAHDVGALGYFGNRQVRDLAGLVMPDVIPFLWNDEELSGYLDQEEVDYLFTFKDWYPGLVSGKEIAYQTNGKYAPLFGMENFAIYYWE
jgi:hypothetical protein